MKKPLIPVMAGLISLMPAKYTAAQNTNPTPRTIELDFTNPLDDIEANTKAFYLAKQISGRGIENLFENSPNKTQRSLMILGSIYTNLALEYYSHELGHDKFMRDSGVSEQRIDFSNWSRGFPGWIHNYEHTPSKEDHNKNVLAGLNQDELNAKYTHEQTEDITDWHNGTNFLVSKLADTLYTTFEMGDRPSGHEEEEYNKLDSSAYRAILKNQKDILLTKGEYILQCLITDFLSMKTWDSMRAVKNFYFHGNQSTKTTNVKTKKGLDVSFPLFSTYLTDDGTFINSQTTIKKRGKKLKLGVGIDTDWMGGKSNTIRLGGKLDSLKLKNVKVSPFVYLTQERKNITKNTGSTFGLEGKVNLFKNAALTTKIQKSQNDIIENRIKGKKNGFNARVGIKYRF